jgi:hypothetical protein
MRLVILCGVRVGRWRAHGTAGEPVGAHAGFDSTDLPIDYFFPAFLSCFGFLTSFLRTLLPLPMTKLLINTSAAMLAHGER